jgi:hypothetical protein
MEDEKRYPMSEIQVKGVNMVIKALMKRYEFIKGWELTDEHENYENILFINIIMDYQEFADNHKYYFERLKYSKIKSYGIVPYVERTKGVTDNELKNEVIQVRTDIEDSINIFYDSLPDEYKVFWRLEGTEKDIVRKIMVTNYIDTYEPDYNS